MEQNNPDGTRSLLTPPARRLYIGSVAPIVVGVLPAKPFGERFDRR